MTADEAKVSLEEEAALRVETRRELSRIECRGSALIGKQGTR